MPNRNKKRYNRPKKLYDKQRISEENELTRKYGLKNKKEVWKAEFAIGKIRDVAKKLIAAPEEERKKFVDKQKEKGFNVETVADVLGLNKEDYLKRRLQSVVVRKSLARTHKQARQFIAHKHITIEDRIISSPSHLTTLDEESKVKLIVVLKKNKDSGMKKKEAEKEDKEENEEKKEKSTVEKKGSGQKEDKEKRSSEKGNAEEAKTK